MVDPRFVTLTFKSSYKYSLRKLHRETIVGLIRQLQVAGTWRLAAELTEKGDLHYHIMIAPKDTIKLKVLCNFWQRTYGFVDNKKQGETGVGRELYTSRLRLFTYLRKDSNFMPEVLGLPDHPMWKIMTNRYYSKYIDWFKLEKIKLKYQNDELFKNLENKFYTPVEA